MIYILRPSQGYGSRTSQSEETNKVKDPVKTVDTWLGKLKAEDKSRETLRSYVKDIKVFAKYLAGAGSSVLWPQSYRTRNQALR